MVIFGFGVYFYWYYKGINMGGSDVMYLVFKIMVNFEIEK